MLIAVSPYHMTTREPPALAALLLAERVVTMIPSPVTGTGRAHLHRAVERSPVYLQFMRSWEWSLALWRGGVIASSFEGEDPYEDVIEASARLTREERFAELQPLMHPGLMSDDERYLDAISRDVLRGGPDPGFSVPVAAGLDAFAARSGAFVARAEPVSVCQRAEVRLARPTFSVAVPVLVQAQGEQVLRAREALEGPLSALRRAVLASAHAPVGLRGDELAPGLRGAAGEYARAFDEVLPEITDPADDQRMVAGFVALEGMQLGTDAALEASLVAVRRLHAGPSGAVRGLDVARPVEDRGVHGGVVRSIVVRVIGGARPGRRA